MSSIYWLVELQIQDGQSDNFKSLMRDMVAATEANEPGTLNYEWSASADGKICHIYERYVDSGAVMKHLGTFGEFAGRFMEVFTPLRFTLYGSPSAEVKDALAAFSPTYMELSDGFSR